MELNLETELETSEMCLGEKLAIQFKEKTGSSLEHFYKSELTKLIWYLRKYCGNNIQLATEIADTSFLKAYETIHKFDNTKSKFNTWLYTVARNVMLRDNDNNSMLDSLDEDLDGENKFNLPTHNLECEIIENQEMSYKMQVIQESIESLPEKYALILTLREIDGLSYKDIEDVLDINENTVKLRLHVGRKKLVEIVKPKLIRHGYAL